MILTSTDEDAQKLEPSHCQQDVKWGNHVRKHTTAPQKETGAAQPSNPPPRNANTGPHRSCTGTFTAALRITKRAGKDNQQTSE